jgi:4-oxalocrotonate tautomerase family enzyme
MLEMMNLPLIAMYFGEGELTPEQKINLSRKVTDLVVNETGKPQHYTWIMLHEVPAENWMIDRLTLSELRAKLGET